MTYGWLVNSQPSRAACVAASLERNGTTTLGSSCWSLSRGWMRLCGGIRRMRQSVTPWSCCLGELAEVSGTLGKTEDSIGFLARAVELEVEPDAPRTHAQRVRNTIHIAADDSHGVWSDGETTTGHCRWSRPIAACRRGTRLEGVSLSFSAY